MEEIGGKISGQATGNEHQLTSMIVKQVQAANTIAFFLSRRVRRVIREWRGDTEAYINEINFRIRNQRMFLQKQKVQAMISIKVANEKALMRICFSAFSRWKLDSQIEGKALDRRQQLFLMNNAKLEVQRSKAALQSLYR